MLRVDFLIPFIVGFCAVIQAGLNRKIAASWGLSWTIVLNTSILLAVGFLCLSMGLWSGKAASSTFRLWYLIPGLAGFAIVAGLPLSVGKIGALSTFLILISAQIIFSALWDKGFEGIALSWTRALGATLVLVGAWIATR